MEKKYIILESAAKPGTHLYVFVSHIIWLAISEDRGAGTQIHLSDGKGLLVKETPKEIELLLN